ncbi:MAG TPA: hypothetical protein VHA30_02455 [Patescibacteria group bacterium]|nr:hypothetical protein [Patescibacteria group bacterium]
MSRFFRYNLLVLVLLAGFFAAAALHTVFMDEAMAAAQDCATGAVQTQNCRQPPAGLSCCATEASAMQSFLQAPPQQFQKVIISAIILVSFLAPLGLLLLYESSLLARLQSWRLLTRRRLLAFHHQIGSWLAILEKRDPAHKPLWRGFEFAMVPFA